MGFFDRLFSKGQVAEAKAAELRGDLAKAAELYGEAGQPEQAARVILLRGEGEVDVRARLQFFTQAARQAPEGTDTNKTARRKRAELLLALAGDAAVSAVARHEILEAARDLEAVGEALLAAEAYARANDKEGEARALQAAGDVERLEFLLSSEQHKERESRAREDRVKEVDLLIACGRRREALAMLDDLLRNDGRGSDPFGLGDGRGDRPSVVGEEAALRERANGLRARRVTMPMVTVEMSGRRWTFVLGDEIVIGRGDGSSGEPKASKGGATAVIPVASSAVSREHLRITRDGDDFVVRDLQSRNGTQLREGLNLAGAVSVRDGLELKLGRQVPIRFLPSARLPGALEIDVGGLTYVASLGPLRLPGDVGLTFAGGPDGWGELVADAGAAAFAGDVELVPRTTLLAGDAVAIRRGGEPVFRVVST